MNQDWLNRPELKNIEPVKKKFLTDLMTEAQKTSQANLPKLYMKAFSQMNALNLSFSPQETELITEIIEAQMPASERSRFQAIKKMFKK